VPPIILSYVKTLPYKFTSQGAIAMTEQTYSVERLFSEVKDGTMVIPDFQRTFIWKTEDVRQLLISLAGNFHVGTWLFLQTSSNKCVFSLKLVEGVELTNKHASIQSNVKVILDG
jgi:uncharacterized protein with ParB-like and HNH nuclease domain